MNKRRVRLTINGVVCGLITGETEEYMQTLADEVGGMMKQIMDASPLITREAAALAAALSICDDSRKHAELARRLKERNEELEVQEELWQEEKVELLKSAVDTQKDAQLAEKAARLESENTRLQEAVLHLKNLEQQAQALRDENSDVREAAEAPGPREQALALENARLHESIDRLREDARLLQEEAGQRREELQQENQSLHQRLARQESLEKENQALHERLIQQEAAWKAAENREQPAPAPEEKPEPKRLPHTRRNPLRRGEAQLEQEGLKSYFAVEDNNNFI